MLTHARWTLLDARLTLRCPNGHVLTLRRWDTAALMHGYAICDRCPRDEVGHTQRWLVPEEMHVHPFRSEDDESHW